MKQVAVLLLCLAGLSMAAPTTKTEKPQLEAVRDTEPEVLSSLLSTTEALDIRPSLPTEATNDSVPVIKVRAEKVTSEPARERKGQPEQIPWLPLIILTFLITTACTCCKFVKCSPCENCPMFEHRSENNNRYGSQRDTEAMRTLNKRFRATAGYPNCPEVDPFQKYIGNQRLRKYREPAVCIVDDKNEIIVDTNEIYDSIHNSTYTYIKSNGSNDDMRKYKLDLEEKRRQNIERQEMIDRTKTTAKHNCGQTGSMPMSKRNTSNDLEAISENVNEGRNPMPGISSLPDCDAPVYTSRENIFEYWKNKNYRRGSHPTADSGEPTGDDLTNSKTTLNDDQADAWSIHPPTLTPPSTSEQSTSRIHQEAEEEDAHDGDQIESSNLGDNANFQQRVAAPPIVDEITAVECSSSIRRGGSRRTQHKITDFA